ncbi:CDKN2AIP N-terminal-like protein isoform X1 [Dasypus novemcinctus]|uniref:CDKN2AIP N-terminal-like protein isoform X1 n=1 Tax=Dasypus novemcinctus TaxID=9361 RepID=UPI00265E2691|nr:CDKN2AIP N-terminal-like protein isoform X1 [Dasypus novemcinctus]
MVGGEAAAAVEELVLGVRQATDFTEQFRSYSESEKQWKARMEFILRHLPDYRDPPDGGGRLDQLLSLSMVWANHLFLGCSYNKELLDKVMEMADGIEVEDLPQFTTRSELMKKIMTFMREEMLPKVLVLVMPKVKYRPTQEKVLKMFTQMTKSNRVKGLRLFLVLS